MSVPPPNGWGGDLGCVIYETQSELTELTRKKIAVVIFLGKLADSQRFNQCGSLPVVELLKYRVPSREGRKVAK